jgi:hypothetical protein
MTAWAAGEPGTDGQPADGQPADGPGRPGRRTAGRDGPPGRAGSPGEAEGELAFVIPSGLSVRYPAQFVPGTAAAPPPLRGRMVRVADGWEIVQHLLPHDAARDASARESLERQIGAALAVHRWYGASPQAVLFRPVVGYDIDAEEPFVLYERPRGRPLHAVAATVTVGQQRVIAGELVLVVHLLEALGLVHPWLGPDAVHWDGQHIQLTDFAPVTRIGRSRTPGGPAPWASPEQRSGNGHADPRDGLWGVGQLVRYLASGRPGPAADSALARTIGGVFAAQAAQRPAARELLPLLSCPDPLEADTLAADPLEPHRRDFDERLALKRARLGIAAPLEEGWRPPAAAKEDFPEPPSWRRLFGRNRRDDLGNAT